MRNDKKVMIYSIIPVLIGFICYYFLGSYMFGKLEVFIKDFLEKGCYEKEYIEKYLIKLSIQNCF